MSKALVIDVARCSGCYNCQLACRTSMSETIGLHMQNRSLKSDSSGSRSMRMSAEQFKGKIHYTQAL